MKTLLAKLPATEIVAEIMEVRERLVAQLVSLQEDLHTSSTLLNETKQEIKEQIDVCLFLLEHE